ncbi:MAG: hypothetical protein JSS29_13420 [Proteobacteria bacterium]|nr:hypothetical protein [Pseudomonadota bacterium]
MVNPVNGSSCTAVSAASSIGALNGQIRSDQQQLDDWTTCVSAKTTKGQAEIQRLSGALSAAREAVTRAEATHAAAVSSGGAPATAPAGYNAQAQIQRTQAHSLDVWA